LLYETSLNGGTDTLMIFWLLLSVYFLGQKKYRLSLIFLVVSFLVKYVTALLLPFFIWYYLKEQAGLKQKIWRLSQYVFLATLVVLFAYLPFWQGPQTLNGLFNNASVINASSLVGSLAVVFDPVLPWSPGFYQNISLCLFVFFYFFSLVVFLRRPRITFESLLKFSFFVLGLFLLFGRLWFFAKYIIWILPFGLLLSAAYQPWLVFFSGLVIVSPLVPDLFFLSILPPIIVFSFNSYLKKALK
jgi:alpha-1,6-mannosyltransferase